MSIRSIGADKVGIRSGHFYRLTQNPDNYGMIPGAIFSPIELTYTLQNCGLEDGAVLEAFNNPHCTNIDKRDERLAQLSPVARLVVRGGRLEAAE